jgi:PAS domain S-box-containing protein
MSTTRRGQLIGKRTGMAVLPLRSVGPCSNALDPVVGSSRRSAMPAHTELPVDTTDPSEVDAALRRILEGTASSTGEAFFPALVENLAAALGTHGAWVTEYLPEHDRLRALAFRLGDRWLEDYEHDVPNTPCEVVVREHRLVHYPDRILDLYPHEEDLRTMGAVSYLGVPLLDEGGAVMGHLAVLDRQPLPSEPRMLAVFQIFAARAAAELRRLHAERAVREREEKLGRLFAGAMDAIVELDHALRVTQVNPAAETVFGAKTDALLHRDFGALLAQDSRAELARRVAELDARPLGSRALWFPGGLTLTRAGGETFAAEATLSRSDLRGATFYTLILRDVNDRLEAERKIESLAAEAEYLREEIGALVRESEILGDSPALRRALADTTLVAGADSTVLITGETGTGKELFARAIHRASPRRERPLVKVNCAAIPSSLMESEFFGHERGAFTGATQRRVGRFALADRGTLFLDEVGELPLDLQAKLLRVLQEGEFEPVGSSKTVKVDVRIVAATNRDLAAEVQAGRFREDLYYRLSVFPLRLPPLRERPEDVVRLAEAFAERIGRRLGRVFAPLTPECVRRLTAYPWPGNVRELENVIERAAVTALGGRLNLERALPELPSNPAPASQLRDVAGEDRVLSAAELLDLERRNIVRALDTASWRIAGEGGAAALLGMPASTLSSRMKALGIKRPSRDGG